MENFKKETVEILGNGVKVVLSTAPSFCAYVGLFIASGSRHDGKTSGVSHLIEHAIFKGTKNHTYREIMDSIESVVGDINASTSKEETCYQIAIANEYVERAFATLSELFFESTFPDDELQKEKTVVVDEIESYEDVPSEKIYDEFEEILFAGNPLSKNILGTKKSVIKTTREDVLKAYNHLYRPSQLVLSYVGCEKNLEVILELARKYFGKEPERNLEKIETVPFSLQKIETVTIRNKHTHQAHCILGSFAPSIFDPLRLPTAMLANILGGTSFNALLNLALREERGLTYNIEANYSSYSDVGLFSVYFGTDYSKIDSCRHIIEELFAKLINEGLSEQNLSEYKKQMLGQIAVSEDSYMSLMLNNAKSFWWFNHIDTFEEITKKVEEIDNDIIKMVAKKILSPENIYTLIYK